MKQTLHFLSAVVLASLLLLSCKKDDDNSSVSQSDRLMGTWMNISITSDKPYRWSSTVTGTDGYTYQGECAKGTYITFNKGTTAVGGSYIAYDNCQKAGGQGTWTAGNNVLTLDGEDRPIERLDASSLSYSETVFDATNTAVKITYGFKKQ